MCLNQKGFLRNPRMQSESGDKNAQRGSDSLVCICAWCKKVRNENGFWVEIEIPAGGRKVTHGICSKCERDFRLVNGLPSR